MRLIQLVSGITLVAVMAVAFPGLRLGLYGLDLLALAVCLLDWVRTPDLPHMELTRSLPERVGLSRSIARELELSLPSAAGLAVEVYEAYPIGFRVESIQEHGESRTMGAQSEVAGPDRGSLDAHGALRLVRHYRSDQRGVFEFGDVRIRLTSRLGLWQRQARFEARFQIAVQPALAGLRQTLRLAASERWQDLGVRKLRRRGGETEFESLRDYVPGDDVRRVDWKAFARRGKPMVRQYQVERGQELILMIDMGRRMRITTAQGAGEGWSKLDWALDAALQLAAVALSKGDRVGAVAYSNGIEAWVAPRRGGQQQTRLSQALFGLQPNQGDGNLSQALLELSLRHRRRATVVILSDVADPYSIHAQRKALASASQRHRLIFAAFDDPELGRLAELPGAGEAGAPVPLRASAMALMEDRRSGLRALKSSGARILDAVPAAAAAPLLAAWLSERSR